MYERINKALRFLLLKIGFTLLSLNMNAQEYIDIFKLDYSISPSNRFEESASTTTLQEINGDLTLPVKINDSFALLTGVGYERISASFDVNKRNKAVSGITVKLGANVKHNDKWSGTYMFLPKIASDLNNVSKNDFQIGAAMLMKYNKSKQLSYKFGLYTNQEHFGTFIVPMLGFYYINPSKRFEAKVLLPLSADLNYSITKHLKSGVNFKGQVRSYNLNDSFSKTSDRYLSRSTNELITYLQYEMASGFNIQTAIGHSFARSYRIYEEGVALGIPLNYFGDERSQLNTDFSDGWVFKVSLSYRLYFGK